MKILLVTAVILLLVALMMPWCWGYLTEAGRTDMAHAAKAFGFVCGTASIILGCGILMIRDMAKQEK